MRKLFRMKYEKCAGACYAYSDVMRIHTLGLSAQGAAAFLKRLIQIHGPSCGNAQLQFRLDADEWIEGAEWGERDGLPCPVLQDVTRTRFVASFYHYGTLDLFGGATPLEALDKMIDGALAYYDSEEFILDVAEDPNRGGLGHDACEHGDDKKLVEFAIAFSGLDDAQKSALRAEFA